MAKNPKKKLLLILGGLLAAGGIAGGVWFAAQGSGEPVGVFPFEMVGMTEFWGDTMESYGPVTTDRIQTVFLTDTQVVTEVLVEEGEEVKKGDILLTFDTTLTDLQRERKRLEVEKAKLQLEAAEAELKKIRNMKPMEEVDFSVDLGENIYLGYELKKPYEYDDYLIAGHDGKSMETAFICWLRDNTYVSNELLEFMRQDVHGDRGLCKHGEVLAECEICNCTHGGENGACEICDPPQCVHGELERDCDICSPTICEHDQIEDFCPRCNDCVHEIPKATCTICNSDVCDHGIPEGYCSRCYCKHGVSLNDDCDVCNPSKGEDDSGITFSHAVERDYTIQFLSNGTASPDSYYVIFKTTAGNMQLGSATLWQGAHVTGMGDEFEISYFTPMTADYTLPEPDPEDTVIPDMDFGSGFTAAQIAQMRKEQEKKIKDLEFKHKMIAAEYKILELELGDGNVYATIDGKVVSLLPEQEARDTKQPIIKVSGGGGFYIEGSVSELEKENLKLNQEVTVNDWSTGMTYTGTVQSVGDFPSSGNNWTGMGNPNASYFPFTVFVDETADLQAGQFASVQYSTSQSSNGIYLDKAFLRTEQGRSYVYVKGADGRLEKRPVTTGKSLWGSFIEILGGITPEDQIAFPYGKDVKEGAKTVEGDFATLYGY